MDSMEDSGIDSDQKPANNGTESTQPQIHKPTYSSKMLKSVKTSDLQKKLERQRDAARKAGGLSVEQQIRTSLVSRSKLKVPTKGEYSAILPTDQQPLVVIDMDESEDEFEMPQLSAHAQREITQQLIKDGYNLDLDPDDEDLDLIPPRPVREHCICCHSQINCTIQ
ncbi:hypothetical protein NP493_587g04011 [Ridgeia piscesae]|uniref:Protein FAM219A n=1 Tax=Ridgeia piscesae TaxID=27915 RepID=A0AAD9KUL5_RIDPI|nr:hypothetical protein NP493_587g04011 [Ridgeia piscesae]